MLNPSHGPRSSRGRTTRPYLAISGKAYLKVEALEERLVLSTASPTNLSHQEWRQMTFSVENVEILSPDIDLQVPSDDLRSSNVATSSLIGLDEAFANYNYRGNGYTVAVIDSGIDYTHPDLGGGFGNRVVGGHDFYNNDADPMDDNGHGTHVAGIIGSSRSGFTGVAPNIDLVALKVLGSNGSGSFGHVEDALQWVVSHQAQYNIVAVNLSLGGGNFTVDPYAFLEDEFTALKSQGVFIAAAAGNSYFAYNGQQGLAYPAVSESTVSVGATWAGNFGPASWSSGAHDFSSAPDRITSFTQRSSQLDIFAPGAILTSTYVGGGYKAMSGTSMASPIVAGSAALLHQALDDTGNGSLANQDYIIDLMQDTGVTIVDGDDEDDNVINTGLSFKRLDLFAAMDAIPQSNDPPVLEPIADTSMVAGDDLVSVTLSASDPDGDALSYGAKAVNIHGTTDTAPDFTFKGDRLTIDSADGFVGTFDVEVTVSDGQATDDQTFTVTVTNNAPTLDFVADQLVSGGQDTLSVVLSGSDADGDALTFSAEPLSLESEAYRVKQELGLTFLGSYYHNFWRHNEKWITGDGGQWYAILPNGELRRWANSMTATLQPENLIATFDSSFWEDPSKLWDAAPAGDSPIGVTVTGNTLTIDPPEGYVGSFEVKVEASDGFETDSQTFTVTVTEANQAPLLEAIADQAMSASEDLLIVDLVASDADNDALDFTAAVEHDGSSSPAELTIFNHQLFVDPAAGFVGSFEVVVTVSDGIASDTQSFKVTVVNTPPALEPIEDQRATAGKPLTVDLHASDGDGDSLTFSAEVRGAPSQAWELREQFVLRSAGSYYQNHYGYDEKWVIGSGNTWYALLPNGELRVWRDSTQRTFQQDDAVIAYLSTDFYVDPKLLLEATSTETPPVDVSIDGTQLIVVPEAGFSGDFEVVVTVSDGISTATQSFHVEVSNQPPVLDPIDDQTVSAGSVLKLKLSATDPDSDPLTFSAKIELQASEAARLKEELGLFSSGSFFENFYGANEKWLEGSGGAWYALLPNGEFRVYQGSMEATLQPDALIATLDPAFYGDPTLLLNAESETEPPVTLSITEGQLNVDVEDGFTGSFEVVVTASDGVESVVRTFKVTVVDDQAPTNRAPILGKIGDRTISAGTEELVIDLSVGDPDGDPLAISAETVETNRSLYELDQELGLDFVGSYFTNIWGLDEKWLAGDNNAWYLLLPNGELRRWSGNVSRTLSDDALIAVVDTVAYDDPTLLWDAQPDEPLVFYLVEGNQLKLDLDEDFRGSFVVRVEVSDGDTTVTQTFRVFVV